MSKAPTAPAAAAPAARGRPRTKQTKLPPRLRDAEGEDRLNKHWRTYFLAALVETSNVTRSAERAGISVSRVYRVRREHPGFAAEWRQALCEGYENLEMELLGYLRDPDAGKKMDVANAIRLLAQHRQSVAHERAAQDDRSEQEVLDSIDAMIDSMRERAAANAAQLQGSDNQDGPDEHSE